MRAMLLGTFVAGELLMRLPAAFAQVPAAAPGNLPPDFYAQSVCKRPDTVSPRKPTSADREEVSLYNSQVRRYNKERKDFDTCINAYIAKASNDADWITFMVNTAAANANGTNPPSPPAAPGNMPSGFYPQPACIKPDQKPGAAPNARDARGMEARNSDVRTFNVLATDFNACIQDYVARARVDIGRIEKAQREAGLGEAPAAVSPVPAPAQTASAMPATESVTVTGAKSRAALDSFVKSFALPTKLTGKIARWESGICPRTVGQQPARAQYVTQHLKDIAATVGAPVDNNQTCRPNIEIVFTNTPQELLDNVRQHDADYLGYAESSAEREKLALVTRPIQAWYTTQTKDLRGIGSVDSGRSRGAGTSMSNFTYIPCVSCTGGQSAAPIDLGDAKFATVSGNRISDGMRSTLYHVLIVVDPRKLPDYEIGPLADYIALLALTQLNSLDICQQLPSIVNLLQPGCERKPNGITEEDLAYLRGLYKMSSEKSLVVQRNEIADRMSEAMGGR